MSDIKDFAIKDGVLEKYSGPGGKVVIPEGVTCIGDEAFWGRSDVTGVVIPEGVTRIGDHAFGLCIRLKSVVIPESVTSIGNWAFSDCISLTGVVIPESVTIIGDWTFSDCSSLTSVVIPRDRTEISRYAFNGCRGIADADGFVIINNVLYAFFPREWDDELLAWFGDLLEGYSERGRIEIPYGVTRIAEGVFSFWSDLESVVIPSSVTSIGNEAFSGCVNLESVVLREGLTSIGKKAFYGCENLTGIEIPSSVTSIGDEAFSDCVNLESVVLREGLTSIGESAFYGCDNLANIVIPPNVTSIGELAFGYACGLESLWLKNEACLESAAWCAGTGYLLAVGEGEAIRFCAAIEDDDYNSILSASLNGEWDRCDRALMSSEPRSDCRPAARLLAAVDRLRHPVGLTAEAKQAYVGLLRANAEQVIPLAEYFGCPWIIRLLIDEGIIDDTNRKAVNELLKASSDPAIAAFAD